MGALVRRDYVFREGPPDLADMERAKSFVVITFIASLCVIGVAQVDGRPAQSTSDDSRLVGDWHGQSICVVRESACHDEDSMYHVTKLAEKPGWFSMKLDKIVDGKAVTMGTMECAYSSARQALTCEFPRGVMRFNIKGDRMEGTMTLPDGTLWRKLSLKKSAP
jgi:hypothetical protein